MTWKHAELQFDINIWLASAQFLIHITKIIIQAEQNLSKTTAWRPNSSLGCIIFNMQVHDMYPISGFTIRVLVWYLEASLCIS